MHVVSFGTVAAARSVRDALRARHLQVVAWCLVGYLLVLVAWSAPAPDTGDQPPQPAHGVKAAFLFKFLGYVEWPPAVLHGATSPVVVGVLADDAIADELSRIVAKRRVGQHPIEVRRVDQAHALEGVHVLFIGSAAAAALPRLAPEAHRRSVLVVTDFDDALDEGSVINLLSVDDRVRFEVSLEAAERSNLRLSSRMLAVAMWVAPSR